MGQGRDRPSRDRYRLPIHWRSPAHPDLRRQWTLALNTDIPTRADLERLLTARDQSCVSIYLPTTPITQEVEGARIEFKNLTSEALTQLEEAGTAKHTVAEVGDVLEGLHDDATFWARQANSLAVFATGAGSQTFRVPNRLASMVEVSDRFHVKPLLRAVTFPQSAFVLALSQNSVRLLEVTPDLPAAEVTVPDLPDDLASSVREAPEGDRFPRGRLLGDEGHKIRLRQYARRVDEALRPILSGRHQPLILAATEPLESIFAASCSYPHLADSVIRGNPDDRSDAALADASREVLDRLYAAELADLKELYERRAAQDRATGDLDKVARAATFGAVECALLDIDESIPGSIDEESGELTLDEVDDAINYGVVDEIARRVLLTRGRPMAVRREDIPGSGPVAAILRYPV